MPTLSRTLRQLGEELIRIGAARSIRYALRDNFRGLPDITSSLNRWKDDDGLAA